MSVFDDPNQQPAWTSSSATPPERYGMPANAEAANNADRWALIALAVSLTVLLSCVPGVSCLAPLIIGVVALIQARNAANPDRARIYGWIATGIGIVIFLGGLAILVLYGTAIASIMNEINTELR